MKWIRRGVVLVLFMVMSGSGILCAERFFKLMDEEKQFGMLADKVEENRSVEGQDVSQKTKKEGGAADTTHSAAESANEQTISAFLPEYEKLFLENPDFAGWVSIDDTRINYPVMQTLAEKEYYLHRNFEKENSYAGTPFVGTGDLKKESGDLFVYGHNMKLGTMFSDLLKYRRQGFWEKHPVIHLDTLTERREYEIFAAIEATEADWNQPDGLFNRFLYGQTQDQEKLMTALEKRGLYDTAFSSEKGKQLLFLVTCSYQNREGRFVVAAVRVEEP